MLPTNNSYYSSTFIPTVLAIAVHGSAAIDGGREDRPPPSKHDGGSSVARSSVPRPSPSHATPELAPHPWDPVRVPATNAAAPLFLPPALSLIHPPCTSRPRSLSSSPPSGIPQASSLPPPPSPPHGDNNAAEQRSTVEATRDPSPEDVRPWATQSVSSSSPPSRAGGEGRRTQCPVAPPGIVQPLCRETPHGHPSLSSSLLGARWGGSARGGGCRARRQRRKRQR